MKFKAMFSRLLTGLIRWLHRADKKLTGQASFQNEWGFEDLAPSIEVEERSPYFRALAYAIENPRVKNIALTGNYGSGKSSILESFRRRYKQYRYLNISLAVFDGKEHTSKEDHKQIEISILQQIFYHVRHRNIPDSRFKRIRKQHWLLHLLLSLIAVVTLLLGMFILKPSIFEATAWWKGLVSEQQTMLQNYSLVVFGFCIFLWFFILMRSMRRAKLSKLNVIKGEIEIEKLGETSILNNNLEEILYFFEVNPFDVVMIEDLDRFQEPAIFTKLREINNLINNSRQIGRKVSFIYAIKDEMFKDATRAKFFEFIIPVIPVINSSNSADIFFNLLHTGKAKLSLSENFVNDMALYIEDMRMLKNSINEYITYRELLSKQLDPEKLFSMIIYKNLYPSDFAELPLNKGSVYQALQSKLSLLATYIAKMEAEIGEIDQALATSQKELAPSIRELRLVYIGHILSGFKHSAAIVFNSSHQSITNLLEDSLFEKLTQEGDIRIYDPNQGTRNTGRSFSSFEKEVHSRTYLQRLDDIKNKQEAVNDSLRRKRLSLTEGINNQKAYTLSDIFQQHKGAVLPQDIMDRPWLSYLLRNGYIDETYQSYISYFYEGSITRQDRDYLFSIKNNEPLEHDHSLTHTAALVKRIWLKEFEKEAVLNFDMMDFLLTNKNAYPDQVVRFISIFQHESELVKAFLFAYFQRRRMIPEFIQETANRWDGFFSFIYERANFPDRTRQEYFDSILIYAGIADIKNFTSATTLISVLENDSELLWRVGGYLGINRLQELIQLYKLRFVNIQPNPDMPELFDIVYESDAYQLNADMIETILRLKWQQAPENLIELLQTQHYSLVASSGCSKLIEYIDRNIDGYVSDFLLRLSLNTNESEPALINLLSKEKLSTDHKVALIDMQSCRFADINTLPEEISGTLLEKNKVLPTWANVFSYYQRTGAIDHSLAIYLSDTTNASILASVTVTSADPQEEEQVRQFQLSLLMCNEVSTAAYEMLSRWVEQQYTEFDTEGLSRDKVVELVNQRKLRYSVANWSDLKEHHSSLHIVLAGQNPELFIETIIEAGPDERDYLALLEAQAFTTSQHCRIVDHMTAEAITTEEIAGRILELYYHLRRTLPENILPEVFKRLPYTDQKVRFLSLEITSLAVDVFVDYLDSLGEPYNQLVHAEKSALPHKAYNIELVTMLKAHGFIQSYTTRNDEIKIKGAGG